MSGQMRFGLSGAHRVHTPACGAHAWIEPALVLRQLRDPARRTLTTSGKEALDSVGTSSAFANQWAVRARGLDERFQETSRPPWPRADERIGDEGVAGAGTSGRVLGHECDRGGRGAAGGEVGDEQKDVAMVAGLV
jgi:hypothetical protein